MKYRAFSLSIVIFLGIKGMESLEDIPPRKDAQGQSIMRRESELLVAQREEVEQASMVSHFNPMGAIKMGNFPMLKELLDHGFNINSELSGWNGMTLIHVICGLNGNLESWRLRLPLLQHLIDYGSPENQTNVVPIINVNITDEDHNTPAHALVHQMDPCKEEQFLIQLMMMNLLKQAGADFNKKNNIHNNTILHDIYRWFPVDCPKVTPKGEKLIAQLVHMIALSLNYDIFDERELSQFIDAAAKYKNVDILRNNLLAIPTRKLEHLNVAIPVKSRTQRYAVKFLNTVRMMYHYYHIAQTKQTYFGQLSEDHIQELIRYTAAYPKKVPKEKCIVS